MTNLTQNDIHTIAKVQQRAIIKLYIGWICHTEMCIDVNSLASHGGRQHFCYTQYKVHGGYSVATALCSSPLE